MSMNGESLAYFSDGHIEVITEFEISADGHEIWFTLENGRWFVYREELVGKPRAILDLEERTHTLSYSYYPEHKFFKVLINRDRDEFGARCDVQYLVTDEIDRIMLYMPD